MKKSELITRVQTSSGKTHAEVEALVDRLINEEKLDLGTAGEETIVLLCDLLNTNEQPAKSKRKQRKKPTMDSMLATVEPATPVNSSELMVVEDAMPTTREAAQTELVSVEQRITIAQSEIKAGNTSLLEAFAGLLGRRQQLLTFISGKLEEAIEAQDQQFAREITSKLGSSSSQVETIVAGLDSDFFRSEGDRFTQLVSQYSTSAA